MGDWQYYKLNKKCSQKHIKNTVSVLKFGKGPSTKPRSKGFE